MFHKNNNAKNINDKWSIRECNANDTLSESFETIEKMCNKTASDPDSTLYKYLSSDNKDEILKSAKKSYANASEAHRDIEESNLHVRLNYLCINEPEFKSFHYEDVTQLEDIEPPTRLWENTFLDVIEPEISPVKMVGYLRPSTILEEQNESDASLRTSFETARKELSSEVTSSSYETANEFIRLKSYYTRNEDKQSYDGSLASSDEQEKANSSKQYFKDAENLTLTQESLGRHNLENWLNEQISHAEVVHLDNTDKKMNLSTESENSVIELLSDDDEDNKQRDVHASAAEYEVEKSTKAMNANNDNDIMKRLIGFSDSELVDMNNSSISANSANSESLCFNDTMEEVDHIINQYMAQASAGMLNNFNSARPFAHTNPQPKAISPTAENEFAMPQTVTKSPTAITSSTTKSNSQDKGANKENRFALTMKPIPKFNVFKNTNTNINKTPTKQTSDPFKHIVSPIGAYIKKTNTTPLMTAFKPVNTKADAINSPVFKKLDFISHKIGKMPLSDESETIPKVPHHLPKKAYISSPYRQIFDERTPVTIPGGAKIHKLLNAATLPTVMQHEGKIEMPANMQHIGSAATTNDPLKFNECSLAGLPVEFGDLSVYTVKDAQKL